MDRQVELIRVPDKTVLEAFLSGSYGDSDSYGGLDGQGPMVIVDLRRREMVPVPDFQERLESWRRRGIPNPSPLKRKPLLRDLNAFLNQADGFVYDRSRRLIGNFPVKPA